MGLFGCRNPWWRCLIRWSVLIVCWLIVYLLFTSNNNNNQLQMRSSFQEFLNTQEIATTDDPLQLVAFPGLAKASGGQLVAKWAEQVPSIPDRYKTTPVNHKATKCARYPSFTDLNFNNGLWQQFASSTGATFYIFGAYWDERTKPQPVVRILAMVDRTLPPTFVCQLWYSNGNEQKTPEATATNVNGNFSYIWNTKWGNYRNNTLQPFLFTCPVMSQVTPPESISLVNENCDNATNNIAVTYNNNNNNNNNNNTKPKKPDDEFTVAVCVKGLVFYQEDISVKLVEWLELLRILGAQKVYLYELAVHQNVTKVLSYYEKDGFVHRTPLTLPGMQLNDPSLMDFYLSQRRVYKRQNELIPYNDCFYRHRHSYDYITLLDVDEVIVPLQHGNWQELLQRLTRIFKTSDSFFASNVYFFDDAIHSHGWLSEVPNYMHMLQHVWRAKNHTKLGSYVKSFHNTKTVLTLHNHHPMSCVENRKCKNSHISTDLGQLQHYRKDCDASIRKKCTEDYHKYLVMDKSLWRFMEPLVERTQKVLTQLNFLKPTK